MADVAIIAIAPGEGFASVFRGLGVSEVVFGGQTMNPSAQEILDAARRAHARTVIVLPNNGNVVLTAKQASSVAAETLGDDRRILVVGSRTVPQGIGAMMAMTFGADPEAIVSSMTGALTSVRTVEVTRATRDVSINEVDVRVGDVLGLVDDEVVAQAPKLMRSLRARSNSPGRGLRNWSQSTGVQMSANPTRRGSLLLCRRASQTCRLNR